MLKAWKQMRDTMPQMLAAQGLKFFEKDGFPCVQIDPPDGRTSQILAQGKDRFVSVESRKKDLAAVRSIFDAVKLETALGKPE
jgi:hypothetical protein